MMTSDDYQHFVCIVAGDNPKELMAEYDSNKKTEPYIVYKYQDAEKLKNLYLKYYEAALNEDSLSEYEKEAIKDTIEEIKDMSNNEFYAELVKEYPLDNEGNAISTNNKNGKWRSYQMGKIFSIPFLTTDGREVFQAKKSEIDWSKIHLAGKEIYEKAWEMVMEGAKPSNDYEKEIYKNMKDKETYFQKFETKENYVISNTAFWGYAFVSEKTGWQDGGDAMDQFSWMSNFYDMFIKNLDENTLLTIYECTK